MKLCSKFITIIYIYIYDIDTYDIRIYIYIYIYICIYIYYLLCIVKKINHQTINKRTWSWRVRLTLGNRSRCMVTHGTHGTHMGPMGKWWNEAINWWYFMGINGKCYSYGISIYIYLKMGIRIAMYCYSYGISIWIYLNLSPEARLGIFYIILWDIDGILMGYHGIFFGKINGHIISYHGN